MPMAQPAGSVVSPPVRASRRQIALVGIRDSGSDVAELQAKLGMAADGRFGPGTLEAVEKFPAAHGLTTDGVVGRDTWKAINAS